VTEARVAKEDFADFLGKVRLGVDAQLETFLRDPVARASAESPATKAMATAARDLTLRGGKRQRAALLAAAYLGCGGEGGADRVVMAGVAIELVQTYLLVHDDWMDQDDIRRGGPSVHAKLEEHFGDKHLSASTAILAGDWACALAYAALAAVPVPAQRLLQATEALNRVLEDVIVGQALDLVGHPDVERIHMLKTATYTVRLPLSVGAALAGASDSLRAGLVEFADPLGVAFQLRDDLLGAFGEPSVTGKSAGNDILRRKNTALAAELRKDRAGSKLLDAPPDIAGVEIIKQAMIDTGAKERVELRLRTLLDETRARLTNLSITPAMKVILGGAVDALGERIQ
jgi:geranylgeranyl diphosphate synthase type I